MVEHIGNICFLTLIMIVWFKTDAFVEYFSYLKSVKEYKNKKMEDFELTFHTFLLKNHNGFIIRLITCPICLAIWLNIPILWIYLNIGTYAICTLITLILYYLLVRIKQ